MSVVNILQKCENDILGKMNLFPINKDKKQTGGKNSLQNQPEIFIYTIQCLIIQAEESKNDISRDKNSYFMINKNKTIP